MVDTDSTPLQPLFETFAQLSQEYQDLEQMVDEMVSEIDRLRFDLAQEQSRCRLLQEQLQNQTAGFEAVSTQVEHQGELLSEIDRKLNSSLSKLEEGGPALGDDERSSLQEELLNVGRERDGLRTELEQLRTQTTQLAEKNEQQQHEILSSQLANSEQLQEMRDLIAQLGQLGQHARDAVRSASRHPERATGEDGEDLQNGSGEPGAPGSGNGSSTMLDSVAAQFAKLQKDAAKRRRPNG